MKTKEQLLIQKSALEKMLKNLENIKIVGVIKTHNVKYYQSLYDYAIDLTICEKLTFFEFLEVRKLLEIWGKDYTLGCSLDYKKAWLVNKLVEADKKLRRREKIANFFGAIKGLFGLNKMLKKWNFNNW